VIIELFSLSVMVDALYERTSIGNRRFQGGWSIWPKISRRKRHPPPTICAQASQCITTLPLKVFTQRNFVADFLRKKSTFIRKTDTAFLSPLGGLGTTYVVHPRLIGKPVVDLLLAIIELFFARCKGWGVTSDWKYPFFEAGEGVGLAQNFR